MTAVDLLTQPQVMAQVKHDFDELIDMNAGWREKKFFS